MKDLHYICVKLSHLLTLRLKDNFHHYIDKSKYNYFVNNFLDLVSLLAKTKSFPGKTLLVSENF